MLRPEQVRLGRQHKDICVRLRDDIEKAHREYDRRFKPIMDHPVDYFYRWMVEILAEGDANALGEYPYATTAQTSIARSGDGCSAKRGVLARFICLAHVAIACVVRAARGGSSRPARADRSQEEEKIQ